MATFQELLRAWHKLISKGEIETAYEQLKLEIASKKWTAEQENQMANYCLISTNMKAYEFLKNDVKDPAFVQQIFSMANFCCCIIEKTWKCTFKEFLGSVHIISRYFLTMGNIYEALVIGQYSMEFADNYNDGDLSEDENGVVRGILLLYLHHSNKISTDDTETTLAIWKFILSYQGLKTKSSNFASILTSFGIFCNKTNSTEALQCCLRALSYLSRVPFVNLTDKDIDTYLGICEGIIRYSKADQLKNTIESVLCSIEDIKSSCNSDQLLVIEFYCDILRFSICSGDVSSCSILVDKCNEGLKSIQSTNSIFRNRAVNFARIMLIQAQNCWIDKENFFYRKCLANLFAFFVKLAKVIKFIEINQDTNTSEKKYYTVASLALMITHRIQDLSTVELSKIYSGVKQCLGILLDVYQDNNCKMDNTQTINLYNNIGAHSFNLCCFYMKAKLYSECEELSLMASQRIASLSNDLIQSSSLEPFIEKLAICLYQSTKYENALKTMCIWAAKLPNSRNTFMDRFGSFKAKLFLENQDRNIEYLNKTCFDLIKDDQQKNPSFWEKIDFTDRDIMVMLKLELKQCLTHQIHSAVLIEKIIQQGMKRNDNINIELCILSGLIFTQSCDFLSNAMRLLPHVENFIEELNQKLKKSIPKENVIQYSNTLGTLHYVKFRIKLLNARCENEEEVILTKSINKPVQSEPGMEQETRDDSDVIHKNLTYKSQQEFIYFLDTAIDCWSRAITEASDKMDLRLREKCSKICTELDIQTLIHETALMYRLYCAESKEIRAWRLLHSLAAIREDEEMIVHAFSNLVSLNAELDPECETIVEEKLTNVEKITQTRYRLETIRKLFINGRGIEGVTILSQISQDDVKNNVVLEAKYHFLISQYTLAGFYKVSDYPMSTAIRAFYLLIPCIKRSSWRNLWEACEIQSLLLDVTLFILNFHVAAFQTNFIKSYLDKAVYLIKKLGLPLRICQVLTTLCTVGVITCKTDDIYVKLDALKSVLKFNESVKEEIYDKELPAPAKTVTTLSPEFSSNSDVRFVSNLENNYASPILDNGLKYDMPEFVGHKSNCDCVVCDDVLYQQISCEVMSLFGCYFWLLESNHHGQALRHFKDSLEMSSQLRKRWSRDRIKSEIFLKSEMTTKMRLGDFWASNGEFEKCRDLNKEALDEYENLIIPDAALRTQLNDQYFAVEHIKLTSVIKQDLPKKKVARQRPALGITVTKTPACKTTVTVFEDDKETSRITELMKNMAVTPLPKRSRRLLSFKNDDDNLKPPASARTARIQNTKKEETPPDIVMQTPSSLRTTSRKILQGKTASSTVAVKNDDDFFATPKPTASNRITRIKNKKQETPPDIVMQTPSSLRTSSRKIYDSKVSSSIAVKNDDDYFTTPGNPTQSSRIAKLGSKKQENTSPDKVAQTPTPRARSKKILGAENSSSVIFKKDEDLVASVSKLALPIRTSRIKSKKEESSGLDIVKQNPSSSSRTRTKKVVENVSSSAEPSSGLRIRKN